MCMVCRDTVEKWVYGGLGGWCGAYCGQGGYTVVRIVGMVGGVWFMSAGMVMGVWYQHDGEGVYMFPKCI